MTKTDAHTILADATKHVDFINFGGIISQLGEQGFDWGKFNNQLWRWNYNKALAEVKYLQKNMEKIFDAVLYLYNNRVEKDGD